MSILSCKEHVVKAVDLSVNLLGEVVIGKHIEDETIVELEVLGQLLEGVSNSNSIDVNAKECLMLVINKLSVEKEKLESIKSEIDKKKENQEKIVSLVKEGFDSLITALYV